MTFTITVTFEFENDAPLTRRTEIAATSVHTAMSRAVREARQAWKRRKPSSVVCVAETGLSVPRR